MASTVNQLAFLSFGKYGVYLLTFLRGVLIAKVFTFEQYADWGIVMFVTAYYSILGLGIPNLILLAVEKYSFGTREMNRVISAAILFISVLAVVMNLMVFLFSGELEYLSGSISVTGLITISYGLVMAETLRNLARLAQNYRRIVLADVLSVLPLLLLLIVMPNLLTPNVALLAMIVGVVFSIMSLWNQFSFEFCTENLRSFGKEIILRGLPILFYNYSSYSLFIIFRADILASDDPSLVSNFNFAWLLTNSIILFLGVINWYFYPSLLKSLALKTERIRYNEILFLQIIVSFLVLFLAPVLFEIFLSYILPKYSESIFHFKFLLNTQIILYLTFYASTYLVASKKNSVFYIGGAIAAGSLFIYLFLYSAQTSLYSKYLALHLVSIIFGAFLHINTPLKDEKHRVGGLLVLLIMFPYIPEYLQALALFIVVYQTIRRRRAIYRTFIKLNEASNSI